MTNPSGTSAKARGYRLVARTVLTTATAAAFIGLAGVSASAAPGDDSADTVVANVGVNSSITLSGLTGQFTLNGLPGDTVAEEDAVSFNVNSNNVGGYNVTVQSETATLAANTDAIPIGALGVRTAGAAAYTPVSSTAPFIINTKAARSAAGGDDYSHDYTVDIPFVADDTYTATLDYVATAL
jgi:hypothetical protein